MRSPRSRRTAPATSWRATRPQTIGYALLDSPVALAAWMLDHDTDGYYKMAGAFVDGRPTGNLTKEHIVDNVTLYWLGGTGASAARDYWEDGRARAHFAVEPPPPASVPVGFTTFPDEVWGCSAELGRVAYPDVAYFNEVDRGGHFAAWEEPELRVPARARSAHGGRLGQADRRYGHAR